MAGAFVISLDFELMWGVRDHRTIFDYGEAVLGGRRAIPEILRLFRDRNIHATWATVGLLFARNKDEMLTFAPDQRPSYSDGRLSPYPAIEKEIGRDETDDPYHFGRSLVELIAETPGQEMATHTYSHYYCMEEGQTPEEFRQDIRSALAIASHNGMAIRSIVFPRNQMTERYLEVCAGAGIETYRGNSDHFAYRSRSSGDLSLGVRAFRYLDGLLPLTGAQTFGAAPLNAGLRNVRASRFFMPFGPEHEGWAKLHLRRIKTEMTVAAQTGQIYHLWWHPHNFGRHVEASLARLEGIISHFQKLQDEYGMRSASMSDPYFKGR